MKNYEGLELTRNSELVETYYEYDEDKEEGFYKERKIDKITAHYLHEIGCELEEGVTLGGLFKYLDKNLELWDFLVGNWCAEIVKEGLKEPEEKIDDLKGIELYWSCEKSKYEPNEEAELYLGYRMEVHGRGLEVKDDNGNMTSESYSISFIKANTLAQLPILIDTSLVLEEIEYYDNYKSTKTILGKQVPTLFQIVHSILWELSFHGGPKEREEEHQNLKESYKEALKQLENIKEVL